MVNATAFHPTILLHITLPLCAVFATFILKTTQNSDFISNRKQIIFRIFVSFSKGKICDYYEFG